MWLRRSRVPLTLSLRNLFSKVGRRSVFIITSGECDERLWFWVSISFQLCVRERHSFVHWEAFFLSLQNQFHPVIRLSIGFDVVYIWSTSSGARFCNEEDVSPHKYAYKQYAERKSKIKINSAQKMDFTFHVKIQILFSRYETNMVCLFRNFTWVNYQIIVPFQVLKIEYLKCSKR